jgi:hypothetical protein
MTQLAVQANDYTHDVFVSYHRQPPTKTWIERHFFTLFCDWLAVELGRPARVFWDNSSIEAGDVWKSKILNVLRKSRCLVPVWSKGYFHSRWCIAEWETFRKRAQILLVDGSLIVPIQWHDGESYPPEAKAIFPVDFRPYAVTAPSFPDTGHFMTYEQELKKFVLRVAQSIDTAPPFQDNWPFVDPDDVTIKPLVDNSQWHILKAT